MRMRATTIRPDGTVPVGAHAKSCRRPCGRWSGRWRWRKSLSWGVHHASRLATAQPSFRRRHTDSDANAFTRIVAQPRHIDLATITIFHIVCSDAPLRRIVADHPAMRFVTGVAAVVRARDAVADRAARNCAGNGRGLAAVALANLVAQCPTDDRAQHGATDVAVVFAGDLLVVAFLSRRATGARDVDRIHAQHVGPAEMRAVIRRRVALGLRQTCGSNQRGGNHLLVNRHGGPRYGALDAHTLCSGAIPPKRG